MIEPLSNSASYASRCGRAILLLLALCDGSRGPGIVSASLAAGSSMSSGPHGALEDNRTVGRSLRIKLAPDETSDESAKVLSPIQSTEGNEAMASASQAASAEPNTRRTQDSKSGFTFDAKNARVRQRKNDRFELSTRVAQKVVDRKGEAKKPSKSTATYQSGVKKPHTPFGSETKNRQKRTNSFEQRSRYLTAEEIISDYWNWWQATWSLRGHPQAEGGLEGFPGQSRAPEANGMTPTVLLVPPQKPGNVGWLTPGYIVNHLHPDTAPPVFPTHHTSQTQELTPYLQISDLHDHASIKPIKQKKIPTAPIETPDPPLTRNLNKGVPEIQQNQPEVEQREKFSNGIENKPNPTKNGVIISEPQQLKEAPSAKEIEAKKGVAAIESDLLGSTYEESFPDLRSADRVSAKNQGDTKEFRYPPSSHGLKDIDPESMTPAIKNEILYNIGSVSSRMGKYKQKKEVNPKADSKYVYEPEPIRIANLGTSLIAEDSRISNKQTSLKESTAFLSEKNAVETTESVDKTEGKGKPNLPLTENMELQTKYGSKDNSLLLAASRTRSRKLRKEQRLRESLNKSDEHRLATDSVIESLPALQGSRDKPPSTNAPASQREIDLVGSPGILKTLVQVQQSMHTKSRNLNDATLRKAGRASLQSQKGPRPTIKSNIANRGKRTKLLDSPLFESTPPTSSADLQSAERPIGKTERLEKVAKDEGLGFHGIPGRSSSSGAQDKSEVEKGSFPAMRIPLFPENTPNPTMPLNQVDTETHSATKGAKEKDGELQSSVQGGALQPKQPSQDTYPSAIPHHSPVGQYSGGTPKRSLSKVWSESSTETPQAGQAIPNDGTNKLLEVGLHDMMRKFGEDSVSQWERSQINIKLISLFVNTVQPSCKREYLMISEISTATFLSIKSLWQAEGDRFSALIPWITAEVGSVEGLRRWWGFNWQMKQHLIMQRWEEEKLFLMQDFKLTYSELDVLAELYGLSGNHRYLEDTQSFNWNYYKLKLKLDVKGVSARSVMRQALGKGEEYRRFDIVEYLRERVTPTTWWNSKELFMEHKITGMNILTVITVGDSLQFGSKYMFEGPGRMSVDEAFIRLMLIMKDKEETSGVPWNDSLERAWLVRNFKDLYQERLLSLSNMVTQRSIRCGQHPFKPASVQYVETVIKTEYLMGRKWRLGEALVWSDAGLEPEKMARIAKNHQLSSLPSKNKLRFSKEERKLAEIWFSRPIEERKPIQEDRHLPELLLIWKEFVSNSILSLKQKISRVWPKIVLEKKHPEDI